MADSPASSAAGLVSREVGGLPVWAWGAIVAGGLLLGRRIAGGSLFGGGSQGTVTPFVDPNLTGYTATGEAATSGGGGVTSYTDNNAWRKAAVDYLTRTGTSATAAELAVGRWLNGDVLTSVEAATINSVVRAIGNPPQAPPLPTGTTTVPGAPRPPRSTTVQRTSAGVGENARQIVTRLRAADKSLTTTNGLPITADYIASVNGWGSTTTARAVGTRVLY